MTALAVTGSDLYRAATWAARCSPAKPDFPVLGGLLLEAGDELSLTGWDLDVRATAEVAATTTEPGRLLVSAPLLVAVAGEVGRDDTVLIKSGGGGVQVCCGRSVWTLPLLPLEDYPQVPAPPDVVGVVDGDALRASLARVLPAVSRDASLQMLTGVQMEGNADGLTLCGTDRWRLATDVVPWLGTPSATWRDQALVPGAVLDMLARATAGVGPVTLMCDSSSVGLSTAGHLVTGRLMAAQFPAWRPLVPAPGPDGHAVVDAAALSAALSAAAVVAADPWHLLLAFRAGEVTVTVLGQGRGRAHVVAGCDLRGEATDIVFRGPYLAAALAGCGPTAELHFGSSPTRPVLVRPAGDDPYRHVLCPVGVPAGPA